MAAIQFEATMYTLRAATILKLPDEASKALPSRGQVAVQGTVNGHAFRTVLEPDSNFGHFMKAEPELQKAAGIGPGDTVKVAIEPTKDWPEPDVPKDFAEAMAAAPKKVQEKWHDITPMARWEWVRWVNETGNLDTRAVRIEKSISKMNGSHRRPCCFNLSACTDPELSKSGRLIEPIQSLTT